MKTFGYQFLLFLLILKADSLYSQVGAELVININPSSIQGPDKLLVFNDSLWFVDNDGIVGDEFWVSDGSQAGSRLWYNLCPGPCHSDPYNFFEFNDKLVFVASDLANHDCLYITNGKTDSLFNLESYSLTSPPYEMEVLNNVLIFVWDSASVGIELWRSDGTLQGTHLLKDIRPGSNKDSDPDQFTILNNTLYFTADDGFGREVWKTDGTPSGTVMVADINPTGHSLPRHLTPHNGLLYFAAGDGTNEYALYKTDGITTTKIAVPDNTNTYGVSAINDIVSFNGYLFFQAYDPVHHWELWRSDGTTSGTAMFIDIEPNYTPINPGGYPKNLKVIGNKLFFSAKKNNTDVELWVTDGTVNGTVMVKDINPSGASMPSDFFEYKGWVFFGADDGVNGIELWTSDGTPGGTYMIENINGSNDGYEGNHIIYNNELYFTGIDSLNGVSLWKVKNFTGFNEQIGFDVNTSSLNCQPNPFHTSTSITLQSETGSHQTLKVFDLLGNEICELLNDYRPAGKHTITFNADNIPCGLYILSLNNNHGCITKKMLKL